MSVFIFYLLLSLALITEGTGINGMLGGFISYFIILIIPFILLLIDFLRNRKIKIPHNISLFFFLFLLFSAISVYFSWELKKSFEYLLFYISSYLIFLYAFNHKESIKKYLIPFIFIFSIIFTSYSFFLQFFSKKTPFLISTYGFNFVYSIPLPSISHNHLGDFLVLPLLYCFYQVIQNRQTVTVTKPVTSTVYRLSSFLPFDVTVFRNGLRSRLPLYALLFLFFLPFFFLSYSRSAYLSLAVGMIVILVQTVTVTKPVTSTVYRLSSFLPFDVTVFRNGLRSRLPLYAFISFILIFLLFLFSFIILGDRQQIKPIANIRQFLVEKTGLQTKFLTGNRDTYFLQALTSIKSQPFFGVGPGDFFLISLKYPPFPAYHTSGTAHNIFVDIASENGLFALLFFSMLIFLILRNSDKNIFFILFISMLLNFSFDYTYRIYTYYVFFFIIGGVVYKENIPYKKLKFSLSTSSFITACILFIIALANMFSVLAVKYHAYEVAINLYPLNYSAYQEGIKNTLVKQNFYQTEVYMNKLLKIVRKNPLILADLGNTYFFIKKPEKGIDFFKQSLEGNPNDTMIKKMLEAHQLN